MTLKTFRLTTLGGRELLQTDERLVRRLEDGMPRKLEECRSARGLDCTCDLCNEVNYELGRVS